MCLLKAILKNLLIYVGFLAGYFLYIIIVNLLFLLVYALIFWPYQYTIGKIIMGGLLLILLIPCVIRDFLPRK